MLLLDANLPASWDDGRRIRTADALASAALSFGVRYLEGGWQVTFASEAAGALALTGPDDGITLAYALAEMPFASGERASLSGLLPDGQSGHTPLSLLVIMNALSSEMAAHLCELSRRGSEITLFVLESVGPGMIEALIGAGVSVQHPEDAA
jgi:hypothetical protein